MKSEKDKLYTVDLCSMYVVLEAAEAAFKGSSNCKTTSTVTVLSLLP